jgi:hypothetical protein
MSFIAVAAIASLVTWRVQAHRASDPAVSKIVGTQSPASPSAPLAAFTPGNLVVYRVGSGSGSEINTGNPVFLDEFTSGGSLVQSIALPTTASGAQKQLIASGTSNSEGLLTRSTDGRFIMLAGYASNIPAASALTGTTASAVNRTVGRVDSLGNIDTSTALTDYASGSSPRGVSSDNGTNLWFGGGAGGVRYAVLNTGAPPTTSTQINTGTPTLANVRQVNIFNGQLYFSDASAAGGNTIAVGALGTGLPTTAGQNSANVVTLTQSASAYGFFLADLSGGVAGVDTLYVTDDAVAALTKYSLVGGVWTSNGTVGVNADDYTSVTARVSGTTVTLYAIRKGGIGATGGGELVTLVDSSGYNGAFSATPTLLATAATNTAFRGVALAPEVITVSPAFLFTGTYNASYSFPITASGGVGPYTFAVTSGSVPTGLTLNSDGTWSGIATAIGDFNFTVTATDATGAVATKAYTLTINPVLNVSNDPVVIEGNAGTTLATFTVTLTPASAQTVTVHYSTQDNTATTADNDYVGIGDTVLQFDPGQTSKNIDVTVNGDTNVESNEFFFLNISTPTNANISDSSGTATITNDDANYTVTTTGNAIVLNDVSGNGDPIGMSEPASGQVEFTNGGGRTFSVNGGAATSGTSGPISLSGINSITVNQNAGNDGFFVGAFVGQLPSLTINGGTGNDNVQFSGAVTFAPNANLDIDMQNDDPTPGLDRVDFFTGGQLQLSGTGSATIKVSQAVTIVGSTLLQVQNGNLTIEINQQATPTTGTSSGLFLNGGTFRTTGTGNINVLGKGQSQAGAGTHSGLAIVGGATISSTSAAVGAGTITLNGTGGQGATFNIGVDLENVGTVISSVTGDISIIGHGGAGTINRNYGVGIAIGSAINSNGTAKITINGTGGSGTSSQFGVRISDDDTTISSTGGDISITGQGGTGTSGNNGVGVLFGALISATNGAKITFDGTGGTGGAGSSSEFGVGVSFAGSQAIPVPTKVTSDSGNIQITGHGGSSPNGANIGFNLDSGAQLLATGTANVTINGTGGSTGASDNYGVGFEGGGVDGTTLSSVNGNLTITGIATAATGTDEDGVRLEDSGGTNPFLLTTTGTGSLTISGTRGSNDPSSAGINFVDDANVTLSGASNTFIADSMDIGTSNVSVNAGANALTLRQKTNGVRIAIGFGDTPGILVLSDPELDVITAGTLNLGDANSGIIDIGTSITRTAATNLNLTSGAEINLGSGSLNSNGGDVNLNPGTFVYPTASGTDVTTSASTTVKIASSKDLKIFIHNVTVDIDYVQLKVAGKVDITGVNLALTTDFVPSGTTVFKLIDNDGTDPITGQFNGLAEGATFPWPGAPGFTAKISYGDITNNDVTLTLTSPTAAPATISGVVTREDGAPLGGVTVNLSGGGNTRTITDANGLYRFENVSTDGFYTVTPGLANFSFLPASRSFSLIGNRTDALFTGRAISNPTDNPLNGGDYFVRQQYLDFLNREPDQAGWLYWSDEIARCGNDARCVRQRRLDVSAAFFMSEEFQRSGSYISRLYQAGLGRAVTYAEFKDDHPHVVGGADLDAQRNAFADSFVARAEFVTKYQQYAVGESFVDELLRSVQVDASVDLSSQREALLAAYHTGSDLNSSRSAVLRAIADNTDYQNATFNRGFVQMEYFGYLRRDADREGYDFWLNVLNSREPGNYRGMVCSFVTSAEYQQRFSPIITHSNGECSER